MKKIVILMSIILFSFTLLGETLDRTTYKSGTYSIFFKEKKVPQYKTRYDKGQDALVVEFSNSTISKTVPNTLNVNDKFVDTVAMSTLNNTVSTTIYLARGVDYKVSASGGELRISLTKATAAKKKYTIIVDAGHGGKDSGATGNGYREKDIALDVARYLASELRNDYKVILTRDSDVFIPLGERAEIGNDANADLFISVHLNSASNSSGNGSEVFYYSKKESSYAAEVAKFENSVDSKYGVTEPVSDFILNDIFYRANQQKSAAVAADVLDNIVGDIGLRKRGVFGANFAVLRGSKSPSILVEIGFISNSGDMSYFGNDYYKRVVAKSIAEGVRKHFY